MDFKRIKSVYMLGIGGIGMSALARYLFRRGIHVEGYDKTATTLTNQLISEGIPVHFEENITLLPKQTDLVVYTPAIPKDHKEFQYFIAHGIEIRKRSEVLGTITSRSKTIAVAGTHGKTTTSTLIAHIFKEAGSDFIAFIGGISNNYDTNLISGGESAISSKTDQVPGYYIVEADEFDRSFLQLSPDIAVITSTDPDHLDIYGNADAMRNSFAEFAGKVKPDGFLFVRKNLSVNITGKTDKTVYTYHTSEKADYFPLHLEAKNGFYRFDLFTPGGIITDLKLGVPGMFNLENAIAAVAVVLQTGITEEVIRRALPGFKGVQRRLDFRILRENFAYIDDYAHHPTELQACIRAVKEVFPGKRITGVFQPHLYSRTRDLAEEFARVLAQLDEIVLLDIYPAREKPISGVDSQFLLNKIKSEKKQLCSREKLIEILRSLQPEVLLTLGAGDIDQMVQPIMKAFEK